MKDQKQCNIQSLVEVGEARIVDDLPVAHFGPEGDSEREIRSRPPSPSKFLAIMA
jgi:hypothetical protein